MKKILILFPIILLLILQLLYVIPLFGAFDLNSIKSINSDFFLNLFWSILNAIVSVFFIIVFSFYFAIALANAINLNKRISFLLIPSLLGNVAIGYFLSRLQLFEHFSENRSILSIYLPLFLTNFYQYGSLTIFLFYLRIKDIPNELIQFASSNGYSLKEKIKEIYLPQIQKIGTLLFIMLFILIFNEFSKVIILFRSSPATNTELISHLIDRLFRIDLMNRTELAINNLLNQGILITIIFILFCIILFAKRSYKIGQLIIYKSFILFFFLTKLIRPTTVIVLLNLFILSIFLPISLILADIRIPELSILVNVFLKSVPLFTIVSLFIASYFIICSINLKLLFPLQLSVESKNYNKYIWNLFIYRVIPAVAIGYLGFHFIKTLSINKYLFWIIGQTILSAPIILTFLIYTHIEMRKETIFFINRHRFSYIEILKLLFHKSYKLSYFLVVLFTFSFIWNDDILSYAIRMHIPTPVIDLMNNSIGKSLCKSEAAFSLLPLFVIIGCFLYIINKLNLSNNKNKNEESCIRTSQF